MSATLPYSVLANLASSVRAGHYTLLLGAGVSLDSSNIAGKQLPSGDAFRRGLCTLKSVPIETPLQRVYSILTQQEIADHVTANFKVSKPGASVQGLTRFIWRRIFTFNVDDAMELAYKQPGAFQTPLVYHYADPYVEVREREYVPLIHLHGSVSMPDRGYVFARSEYVRQMTKVNPWMTVLSQFISVEPFIIAGTSLDEVDLDFYLAHRTATTARVDRGPSVLVEPNPNNITRAQCEEYGLLLFEGTIHQFLIYLETEVGNRPLPIDLVPRLTREIFPVGTPERTIIAFSADFELVPPHGHADAPASRFFYGYPPSWDDLASFFDVGRSLTADIIETLLERLSDPDGENRLLLLLDKTGTGKSTVVRRAAFDLASRGVKVLTCSPYSRMEPQSTAAAIDMIIGPLVIVVDNLADQVSSIADIAARLQKKDAVFLCAERSYRVQYVTQVLSSIGFVDCAGLDLLEVEAGQLIALYREQGLLGASKAVWASKQFAKELLDDSIAVACCRILNDFHPLDRIVDSILDASSETEKTRYAVAALAQHCMRDGVRYEVLAAVTGRDGWDDQFAAMHAMPLTYVDHVSSFVIPLSATIASRVLNRMDKEQLLAIFTQLGIAIAPRVNINAIRSRGAEARLASRLFDYDQVVEGFLGDRADTFYERIKPYWQWNSRYWMQLALRNLSRFFASSSTTEGRESLINARHYAMHAVSIEHHPMSLTTLGKVLFAEMRADSTVASMMFEKGFNRIAEAISIEKYRGRLTAQPFVTLFRGVRDYVSLGGRLNEHQLILLREYVDDVIARFGRDYELQTAVAGVINLLPPRWYR